ncbi:dethiobiotin synthase [Acidovorax sp. BL-A-41-H1]|uniref:dethiobiotin synthase n=1 Tax=Acidovorax sp. BL-A-41-H1 TaxID=3421102 RepID=UPI003F7A82A9
MIGCFVTGTDSRVGKTLVCAGLLHALAVHHPRVVGMKPVAAGVVPWGEDWASEDVIALRAASTVAVAPALDNPVLLMDPLPPHIGAGRAGVQIDIQAIAQSYQALAAQVDAVVVDGAGGFHTPLTHTLTDADLAQLLALPVVLVVGLRPGCLNHALLTAEAVRARGLRLAGWVANHIDADLLAPDEHVAFLSARLGAPLLAEVPYDEYPEPRTLMFNLPADWR